MYKEPSYPEDKLTGICLLVWASVSIFAPQLTGLVTYAAVATLIALYFAMQARLK